MATPKSRNELVKAAGEVFDAHPEAEYLSVTSDGQFFLPGNENAAQLHANEAGGQNPLNVYTIQRSEAKGDADEGDQEGSDEEQESSDKVQMTSDEGKESENNQEGTDEGQNDEEAEAKEEMEKLVDKAEKAEVVTLNGSWYKYGDTTLGNGLENAAEKLLQDKELQTEITEKVHALAPVNKS